MARQVITKLIDDLDGTEAATTVRFGLDGTDYTIDLSGKNADKMRKQLAPFTGAAVRVKTGPVVRRVDPAERQKIRAWARRNGHNVSTHGRIPGEVTAAYRAGLARV